MIDESGPEVKSKAITRFCEKMAELPDGWDLAKGLSQREAGVQMTRGTNKLPPN
jgi:hypothetical protein